MLDSVFTEDPDKRLGRHIAFESFVANADTLVLDVLTIPQLVGVFNTHRRYDTTRTRCRYSRKMSDLLTLDFGKLSIYWMHSWVERGLVVIFVDYNGEKLSRRAASTASLNRFGFLSAVRFLQSGLTVFPTG